MANYHSIIHNYGKPQSTFDVNLAIQGLSYKQGKFDANLAKIQETLDAYGNIELANPAAQEYLYERINALVNNIDNLGTADLSSQSVTTGILGHISQAIDPTVIKHYGITQQKKAFEQQILELQKKDSSKISATNYNDALIVSGWNEYMNGGVDADLKSPLVYKPYTDYTEAMLKTAEQLQKLAKHRYEYSESELATLPGYEGLIKTTKGSVTEADWLQILPNYITQEMRDQMAIDARAMYGWSDEKAIESRDAQRDSVIGEYQKKIDSLKSTLNQDTAVEGRIDEYTKGKIEEAVQVYEEKQREAVDFFNKLNTATEIGGYFIEQSLTENLARTMGVDPSVSFSIDPTYKLKMEQLAEESERNAGLYGGDITITGFQTDLSGESSIDVSKRFNEQKKEAEIGRTRAINEAYNNISDPTIKTFVDDQVAVLKNNNPSLSHTEALFEAMICYLDGEVDGVSKKDKLLEANDNYYQYLAAQNKAYTDTVANIYTDTANVDGLYKAMRERTDTKIIVTNPDGSQRIVKTRDFLKERGINSVASFEDFLNSDEGAEVKSQVMFDMALSNLYQEVNKNLVRPPGVSPANVTLSNRSFKEILHYFNMGANILGEDVSFHDVFEVYVFPEGEAYSTSSVYGRPLTEDEIENGGVWQVTGIKIKDGSIGKATDLLRTMVNEKMHSTDIGGAWLKDKSFYDDAFVRKNFSYKNFKKNYEAALGAHSVGVLGMNVATIGMPNTAKEASSSVYWNEINKAVTNITNMSSFELSYGVPVQVSIDPTNQTAIITQFDGSMTTEQKNAAITDRNKGFGLRKVAEVPLKDAYIFMPTIMGDVEMKTGEVSLRYDTPYEYSVPTVTYVKASNKTLREYADFFQNEQLANLATYEGSKSALMNGFYPIFSSPQNKPIADTLLEALSNYNKFAIDFHVQDNNTYASVSIKTANGNKLLKKIEVDGNSLDSESFKKSMRSAPQVFFSLALNMIAMELIHGEDTTYKILEQNLNR